MPKFISCQQAIEFFLAKGMITAAIYMDYMPTVDAVEVVRCKYCKHREEYECNNITLKETKCGVTDEWFCADGERKEIKND